MQPWLDWDGRERGCRRCGRATPSDSLFVWTSRQRVRRLDLQAPRVAGGVVRYERIGRAHLVCEPCLERLGRGGHIGEAALHRLVWLALLMGAVWAVLGWLAPVLAPNVVAAFWRNGAGGR